jgi:pyruvate dehydrogenase E2 component (dihydrolipoamide acetyltransferase)
MPFTVTMPKLSPTMEEGSIAKWHKKEGDFVKAGELLAEIATDKATVEYNALDEGYLRKQLVPVGKMAKVNQPIAVFTVSATESIEGYKPEGIEEKAPKKETVAPKTAKKEAAPVNGATFQQPAFVPEPPLEKYEFNFPVGVSERIAASPLAKKLAKEKGLDLSSVKGTGPGGRVSSRDLSLAQNERGFTKREKPSVLPGTYEESELSPMRKAIAQRLQQAKSFIPHIYVRQEVDAAALFSMREQLKEGDLKITFNDFVIRAVALSLREHPAANSGFDSVSQAIVSFKTIDICVAVTVDGGLITPIIRHADYKNLGEISVEVKELATRARAGKLKPEEYKGGSFTISNMGMFGVSDFAAIINPPQAAILAVGGIEECARVKEGKISAGRRMNLVLSADHRVLDGADAAKFIKTVQKYLENPALLLL